MSAQENNFLPQKKGNKGGLLYFNKNENVQDDSIKTGPMFLRKITLSLLPFFVVRFIICFVYLTFILNSYLKMNQSFNKALGYGN